LIYTLLHFCFCQLAYNSFRLEGPMTSHALTLGFILCGDQKKSLKWCCYLPKICDYRHSEEIVLK
jgi:hypothetical protein